MEHKKISRIRFLVLGAVVFCLVAGAGATLYVADGIHYPDPEGEYQVGRTKLFLTDKSRAETFSENPDDKRELPVTIYYPAVIGKDDRRSTFASKAVGEVIAAYNGLPAVLLNTLKLNSFVDAKPVAGEQFPVLLFSGGLYGQAPFYGSLLESIASEGYIVVAVEHPYSEIITESSDGSLIRYNDQGTAFFDKETDNEKLDEYGSALADVWTADMLYVFDNLSELQAKHSILAGSMNLEKTGIFGHSFGGATTVSCLQERPELVAGINMDGSLFGQQKTNPVYQPIVFMNSSQGAVIGAIFFQEKVVASQTSEACYHMMLMNSTHDSFATDSGLLYDKYPFARPPDAAQINGREALSDLSFYITAFFDQYMLGQSQDIFDLGYSEQHLQIMSAKYDTKQQSTVEE